MKKELLMQILKCEKENRKVDMDLYDYLISLSKEEEDLLKYALSLVRAKEVSLFLKDIKELKDMDRHILYHLLWNLKDLKEVPEQEKKRLFSTVVLEQESSFLLSLLNGYLHNPEANYIKLFTDKNLIKKQTSWRRLYEILYSAPISPFVVRLFTDETLLKHDTYTNTLITIFEANRNKQNKVLFDGLAERLSSDSLAHNEENYQAFMETFLNSYKVLSEKEEKGIIDKTLYEKLKSQLFKTFITFSQGHELLKDPTLFVASSKVLNKAFTVSMREKQNILLYDTLLVVLMNPDYFQDKELYLTLCNRLSSAIQRDSIVEVNTFLQLLDLSKPLSKKEAQTIIKRFNFSMKGKKLAAFYEVVRNDDLRINEEKWMEAINTILSLEEEHPNISSIVKIATSPSLLKKESLYRYTLGEAKKEKENTLEPMIPVLTSNRLLENEKRYKKVLSILFKTLPEKNNKTAYLISLLLKEDFLNDPKSYDYFLNKISYMIDKEIAFPAIFATDSDTIRRNPTIWKDTLEKISSCSSVSQGMNIYYSVYGALNENESRTLQDYVQARELTAKQLLSYLASCEDTEVTTDTKLEAKTMCKVITERTLRKDK